MWNDYGTIGVQPMPLMNMEDQLIHRANVLGININEYKRYAEATISFDSVTVDIDSTGSFKASYYARLSPNDVQKLASILNYLYLGVNVDALKDKIKEVETEQAEIKRQEYERLKNLQMANINHVATSNVPVELVSESVNQKES